jgi:hypothetical protein
LGGALSEFCQLINYRSWQMGEAIYNQPSIIKQNAAISTLKATHAATSRHYQSVGELPEPGILPTLKLTADVKTFRIKPSTYELMEKEHDL